MIAVPYLALGGVGYLIYRGVKKNEAYRAAIEAGIEAGKEPRNDDPA